VAAALAAINEEGDGTRTAMHKVSDETAADVEEAVSVETHASGEGAGA
jgi:hypothetical protein